MVDVSDPTAPFLVASGIGQNGAIGLFSRMELDGAGRTAYASPWQAVPQAIDITDPTAPVYIGECGGGSPPLLSGSLMYWLNPNGGFVGTMDMSALPDSCESVLGGYVYILEFDNSTRHLVGSALAGDYLYIGAHNVFAPDGEVLHHALIFVVDFSDLSAPVHVGTWGDPTGQELRFGGAVAVSDGRLYWAGAGWSDPFNRTLVILDIATDPTSPTLIGEYSSDEWFGEIQVVGTTAYLGGSREGFTIVDCSDPANPVRVGNYLSHSKLQQAALDNGELYVTDFSYGASILDVSDPRTPGLIGKFETGTYVNEGTNRLRLDNWGIAVRDDLAYVATGRAGLQVVNVTEPSTPVLAGEFSPWPAGSRSFGLTLSPNERIVHLGVRTGPSAFVVNFDVSDPANIVDVGDIFIGSGNPKSIARRSDGIAYVPYNAVATVDLADPSAPALLGTTGPSSVDAALAGDLLYGVNSSSHTGPQVTGLQVWSVATPDDLPAQLSHFASGEEGLIEAYAVAASNGRAYIATGGSEQPQLRVLDVSDPESPLMLAAAPLAGALTNDLIVDGPVVYAITTVGIGGGAGVLAYLVYVPGDFDDNGVIDELDFNGFGSCFTGPGNEPADTTCLIFDFDEDSDIDCDDWTAFQAAWSGPDEVPTFIPCDGLPADINGDGVINVLDLIDLLLCFGLPAVPGCEAEDVNADGTVNVLDLIDLLLAFGTTCP